MFKHTNTIYTVSCGNNETKITAKLDLACGVPFVEIVEIVEFGQETLNLRFLDKESLEQLISSLNTVRDELDRFDMNNQSVS